MAIDGHDTAAISKAIKTAKPTARSPGSCAARPSSAMARRRSRAKDTHGSRSAPTRSKLRAKSSAGPIRPSRSRHTCSPHGARWVKRAAPPRQVEGRSRQGRAEVKALFDETTASSRGEAVKAAIVAAKQAFAADTAKARLSRLVAEMTLEQVIPAMPELIGGSADLTPSNGTKTKHYAPCRRDRSPATNPLRRVRARHGRCHERLGAAWRHRALRRDLHGVLPTTAALDPPLGVMGQRVSM